MQMPSSLDWSGMVSSDAKRIVLIGCGIEELRGIAGIRRFAEVVGIASSESEAAVARDHLDRVLVGDADHMHRDLRGACFDCVVCPTSLANSNRSAIPVGRPRRRVTRRERDHPSGDVAAAVQRSGSCARPNCGRIP
jgi:hypothetical protein